MSTPPPDGAAAAALPPWKAALLRRPWLWATLFAFVLTTFIVFGLRPFMRRIPPPPEVVLNLPQWSLVDHNGKPFGSADLEGKVWVADFFFTSCPSICTDLTRRMAQLAEAFARERVDVHLVSISVDPTNDTPEKLREYAAKMSLDTSRWTFVTGTEESVRALILDGFKTHVGKPELVGKDIVDIAHASYFVLVDGQGAVRGFYEALKDDELSRAFHESRTVLREQQGRGKRP